MGISKSAKKRLSIAVTTPIVGLFIWHSYVSYYVYKQSDLPFDWREFVIDVKEIHTAFYILKSFERREEIEEEIRHTKKKAKKACQKMLKSGLIDKCPDW